MNCANLAPRSTPDGDTICKLGVGQATHFLPRLVTTLHFKREREEVQEFRRATFLAVRLKVASKRSR